MSRIICRGVICFLAFIVFRTSRACKPSGIPAVQKMECVKQRGGKGDDDILDAVEKGDPTCLYKYVWTSGGSVRNAKDYNIVANQYQTVYGYNEPSLSDVIFKGCTTAEPGVPNYAITQWFCLEWCQTNCADMKRLKVDGNTKFPFTEIDCNHTKSMNCNDPVKCSCTDTQGAQCSTDSKGGKEPTVGDMIDLYNDTCLSCYYKRPGAKCTWAEVVGVTSRGDNGSDAKLASSAANKASSSSSSSLPTLDKKSKASKSSSSLSSKAVQSSSDSRDTSSSTTSSDETVNVEQTDLDAASADSKNAIQQWVKANVDRKITDPPPTSQLEKRINSALISVPETEATDNEKAKAKDPEMVKAVKSAKDKLAARLARRAARRKFWDDLANILKQYKGAKRSAILKALEALKELKQKRKHAKGKDRRDIKIEMKKVMANLSEMINSLKATRNEAITDSSDTKQKAIKATRE